MKIKYQSFNFRAATLAIIEQANAFAEDYASQGYSLTLRQLYYRFVAAGLIPNRDTEYSKLGATINNARLAGLLDWDHITDRTRNLKSVSHWDTPADIISSAAHSFRVDKWASQNTRVEVWVEKEALADVVGKAATPLDTPFFSCRGYVSQSEMWAAAMRLRSYTRAGQTPVVIHLGDHDPSGIDMTRDIQDRLAMFGARMEVNRIALNMDQIERYAPPPNPAKSTDSRFMGYVEAYGDESWELDALDPRTLDTLIARTIRSYMDIPKWEEAVAEEAKQRAYLRTISDEWTEVENFVSRELDVEVEVDPELVIDEDEDEDEDEDD